MKIFAQNWRKSWKNSHWDKKWLWYALFAQNRLCYLLFLLFPMGNLSVLSHDVFTRSCPPRLLAKNILWAIFLILYHFFPGHSQLYDFHFHFAFFARKIHQVLFCFCLSQVDFIFFASFVAVFRRVLCMCLEDDEERAFVGGCFVPHIQFWYFRHVFLMCFTLA